MSMVIGKELIVVGGPNGSGKSTFIRELLTDRPIPYHCADDIARELSPDTPGDAQLEAGREFLIRVDDHLSRGESCVVESTLSGRTFTNILWKSVAQGMRISIVFFFADSPNTCVARVRERVRKGGHHVPEADIRRRFNRSASNFWSYYRHFANAWILFHNGGIELREVALRKRESYEIRSQSLFQGFLSFVENLIDKDDTYRQDYGFTFDATRIGSRAVRRAQEESRQLGIPNVYSINGILHYELPNGELTCEEPEIYKRATEQHD